MERSGERLRRHQSKIVSPAHNKHDIPDPRDCFEDKTEDYAKADKLLEDLHLTESELETLNCCMNKMKRSEIAAELGITIHGVRYRKLRIKQKYNQLALV